MDENQFWFRIWSLITTAVVILILTVGGCTYNVQNKVLEANDPIAAACAAWGSYSACIVAAGQEAK